MELGQTMLEPEFHEPYKAWKAKPNQANTGSMLRAMQPIVDTAVKTYVGGKPSPNLKSRAQLMALEGLDRYDPNRAKLKTHLMSHMQGMRRYTQKDAQVISIPERVALENYHLSRAEEELRTNLGREPSTVELADHTGLSTKRIGYIRKARPGLAEGQTQVVGEEDDLGTGPAVIDPMQHSHILNFVYHDLHPTDQLILEHTLGINGRPKRSKQWIAKKLMLSPGAISQRAARIQEKIDTASDLWPGGPG